MDHDDRSFDQPEDSLLLELAQAERVRRIMVRAVLVKNTSPWADHYVRGGRESRQNPTDGYGVILR